MTKASEAKEAKEAKARQRFYRLQRKLDQARRELRKITLRYPLELQGEAHIVELAAAASGLAPALLKRALRPLVASGEIKGDR